MLLFQLYVTESIGDRGKYAPVNDAIIWWMRKARNATDPAVPAGACLQKILVKGRRFDSVLWTDEI
jgi:hypothetical protein